MKPTKNEAPPPNPNGLNALNKDTQDWEGRRYQNNPAQQTSAGGFMDTHDSAGNAGGVVLDATSHLGGHGSLQAPNADHADGSMPMSYTPSALKHRQAVSPKEYKDYRHDRGEDKKHYANGLKAGSADHKQAYIHNFHGNTGDIDHNLVALNQTRKDFAYINEREPGLVNKQGCAEVGWSAGVAKVEHEHKSRFGKTYVKASADLGVAASVEGEYQTNRQRGTQAHNVHGKAELNAGLNSSAEVTHRFNDQVSVGGRAFVDAGLMSCHEASLVTDREERTLMGKVSTATIAGLYTGADVWGQVGPVKGEARAAKIVGTGYVFNVAAGMNQGVTHAAIDLGAALGAGGCFRVGGSVDTNPVIDYAKDRHNRLTNPHYNKKIAQQYKRPSPEELGRMQRRVAEENLVFKRDFDNRLNNPHYNKEISQQYKPLSPQELGQMQRRVAEDNERFEKEYAAQLAPQGDRPSKTNGSPGTDSGNVGT